MKAVSAVAPGGWSIEQIDDIYDKLDTGKRFDQKTSFSAGAIPVVDQSADGFVGYNDEEPGVVASPSSPVVTFANHTCEMRIMRRPFSAIQNVFALKGRDGVCETLYLYYGTKGRVYLEEYKGHYPDYRRLWIPLPPLPEQRRIAKILGDLDDKIELNRKMNETLEQMARALFKSWFVDFDPVRAKMEGRTPTGMDAATAALFPDRLVDSELGPIPEGWEVKALGEVVDIVMGQSPPGESYNEVGNGVPFYQGRTDFEGRFPKRRMYCTAPMRYAKAGDTLLSVRAPVGDINMSEEACCIGRGLAAIRHKTGAESFTFQILHSLSSEFASFEAEGTVFGSINKQNLERLLVKDAPDELVLRFENSILPLEQQIKNNIHQSRTLSTLRDTLLPKLVSGEVRV